MKKLITAVGIGTVLVVGLEAFLRYRHWRYWKQEEDSIPWEK
tara:strand:+ start:4228 stop:4353 length:126 start_codon:yes stop_codon:yes gene_type:complete